MMKFVEIAKSLLQLVLNVSREDRIAFSHRVYMRHPSDEITLVSLGIDNVQSMKISVNDAKKIFRSIKRACEQNQAEEIKTDRLYWRTDARIDFPGQDTVVIQFDGPLGFTRELVKRQAATTALMEFTRKFGLD
jgi:hypothetical protein